MDGVPWLHVLLALLPFAVLIVGFTVFRMDALKLSLYVWLLEIVLAMAGFGLSLPKVVQASLWGNVAMWTGYLVLYSGQVFGQAFRSTGMLRVLLDTLARLLPSTEGKALTLSSVVGGIIGAFNGFATYPITIPGLVELGIGGMQAAAGYLVYFSWSIAFVSLFIAATIASTASGLPISDIAQVMGLLTIPGVIISTIGFFKIMGFSLAKKANRFLVTLSSLANVAAILIFTQWLKDLYILTLIAGAVFTATLFYLFRSALSEGAQVAQETRPSPRTAAAVCKAVAPIILGAALVILWKVPAIARLVQAAQFSLGWWGHKPVAINIINTPGFFILVTAAVCYPFAVKRTTSAWEDLRAATKRSLSSLATLFFGSAMVYLMVDSGQIDLLARAFTQWGAELYAVLLSVLTFLAGMAFGQGMPADFMFSGMQVKAAAQLGVPVVVLVGLAALMTMGPANPLKPSLLRYTSSLAKVSGQDGLMFKTALPWQVAQLCVVAVLTVILLGVWG